MLQAVNTDLFNPLVPKAHNNECQKLLFSLQIEPEKKSVKAIIGGFLFLTFDINGLIGSHGPANLCR